MTSVHPILGAETVCIFPANGEETEGKKQKKHDAWPKNTKELVMNHKSFIILQYSMHFDINLATICLNSKIITCFVTFR